MTLWILKPLEPLGMVLHKLILIIFVPVLTLGKKTAKKANLKFIFFFKIVSFPRILQTTFHPLMPNEISIKEIVIIMEFVLHLINPSSCEKYLEIRAGIQYRS